ncbi:MAG TPA: hypothetical protein VGA78_10430 [Gemmatimonadales bacterium]
MSELNSPRTVIVALVLLAHTAVGVLGGIALDRVIFRPGPLRAEMAAFGPDRPGSSRFDRVDGSRRGGGPPPGMRHRMLDALGRDLSLTQDQRQKIDSIFLGQEPAYRAVREEFAPRLRGLMEETRLSIEKVLTPEQVQRFRERHRRHLEDERL